MDIFVYTGYTIDSKGQVDYPTAALKYAELVQDITSTSWVERYREPGEFELTAPIESPIRTTLPIGSLISQIEGQEVMIVENHEVVDNGGDMEVKVSGRSFECFLENRVVGQDGALNSNIGSNGYYNMFFSTLTGESVRGFGNEYMIQNTAAIWTGSTSSTSQTVGNFERPSDSAQFLIERLLGTPEAVYPNKDAPPTVSFPVPMYSWPWADTVKFVAVVNNDPTPVPPLDLTWKYPIVPGQAHQIIVDILGRGDLGIATHRPGSTSPMNINGGIPHPWPASYVDKLALWIYKGFDRTDAVTFSYAGGDISEAEYLWSNKNERNSAFVFGNFRAMILRNELGYKQRTLYESSNDQDKDEWKLGGTPSDETAFQNQMRLRAQGTLSRQEVKRTNIFSAKLISQQKDIIYRRDYGLGDLVTVIGDHGLKQVMKVSEYVEIEDSNGEINYPTLVTP